MSSQPGVNLQRRSLLGAATLLAAGCKPAGAYDVQTKRAPFVIAAQYKPSFVEDFSVADLFTDFGIYFYSLLLAIILNLIRNQCLLS